MEQTSLKVYGYRWVVLLVFMFAMAMNQMLWITFAPITSSSVKYFNVPELNIGLLSMVFMIVYIIVSIPASWLIDTYGIRMAVGLGAGLTGVFGLMRGLVAPNYYLVLIAQIGIAVGQPFMLNAITKVSARWFPLKERATAAGLASLALYLGIVLGLTLTPFLILKTGIGAMLIFYGILAISSSIVFFVFIKERPPTAPCPPDQEARSLVFEGLGKAIRNFNFLMLLAVIFIGLGIFNAVTTWVEDIVRPRGFSITQAGTIGGLMVAAGIIGALIIPLLSDKYRKRVPFIALAIVGAILGLIGITFAQTYFLLLLSAFILGFFLLSAGPIAFQYGAEITYPAPEGTTNGLLLMSGQVSGILFIFGMDAFREAGTNSMAPSLMVFIILLVLSLLFCIKLKESKMIQQN